MQKAKWKHAEFIGVQAIQEGRWYEIQRPILQVKFSSEPAFTVMDINADTPEGKPVTDFREGVKTGKYLIVPHPPEARAGHVAVVASGSLVRAMITTRSSTLPWCHDPDSFLQRPNLEELRTRIAYLPVETASDWAQSLPGRLLEWARQVARHQIQSGQKDKIAWMHAEEALFVAWDLFNPQDLKTISARHDVAILLGLAVCETEDQFETKKLKIVTRRAVETERLVPTLQAFFAEMLRVNKAIRKARD